ncbi:uncharacterized protein LOC144444195 [Glandiceps talaboti]
MRMSHDIHTYKLKVVKRVITIKEGGIAIFWCFDEIQSDLKENKSIWWRKVNSRKAVKNGYMDHYTVKEALIQSIHVSQLSISGISEEDFGWYECLKEDYTSGINMTLVQRHSLGLFVIKQKTDTTIIYKESMFTMTLFTCEVAVPYWAGYTTGWRPKLLQDNQQVKNRLFTKYVFYELLNWQKAWLYGKANGQKAWLYGKAKFLNAFVTKEDFGNYKWILPKHHGHVECHDDLILSEKMDSTPRITIQAALKEWNEIEVTWLLSDGHYTIMQDYIKPVIKRDGHLLYGYPPNKITANAKCRGNEITAVDFKVQLMLLTSEDFGTYTLHRNIDEVAGYKVIELVPNITAFISRPIHLLLQQMYSFDTTCIVIFPYWAEYTSTMKIELFQGSEKFVDRFPYQYITHNIIRRNSIVIVEETLHFSILSKQDYGWYHWIIPSYHIGGECFADILLGEPMTEIGGAGSTIEQSRMTTLGSNEWFAMTWTIGNDMYNRVKGVIQPTAYKDGHLLNGFPEETFSVSKKSDKWNMVITCMLNIHLLLPGDYGNYTICDTPECGQTWGRLELIEDPKARSIVSYETYTIPMWEMIYIPCSWKSPNMDIWLLEPFLNVTSYKSSRKLRNNMKYGPITVTGTWHYYEEGYFFSLLQFGFLPKSDSHYSSTYFCVLGDENIKLSLVPFLEQQIQNHESQMNTSLEFICSWNSSGEHILNAIPYLKKIMPTDLHSVQVSSKINESTSHRVGDTAVTVSRIHKRSLGLNIVGLKAIIQLHNDSDFGSYECGINIYQMVHIHIFQQKTKSLLLGTTTGFLCSTEITLFEDPANILIQPVKDGKVVENASNVQHIHSETVTTVDRKRIEYHYRVSIQTREDYGNYTCRFDGIDLPSTMAYGPIDWAEQAEIHHILHLNLQENIKGFFVLAFMVFIVCMICIMIKKWYERKLRERDKKMLQNVKELCGFEAYVPNDYKHDIFISYCSRDQDWVVDELLPQLENEWKLKVHLDIRDFIPGRPILKNISEGIFKSHKFLAVFSPAFLKSKWCSAYELVLAFTRHMSVEGPRDSMMVIRYKDCPVPDLIKQNFFLDWSNPQCRPHFWNQLKKWAGPSNFPVDRNDSDSENNHEEVHHPKAVCYDSDTTDDSSFEDALN